MMRLAASVAAVAALALTSCAAPSESASPSLSVAATPMAGQLIKGSRICITNLAESKRKVRITWNRADSTDYLANGVLPYGETTCGNGESTFLSDVSFNVTWSSGVDHNYVVSNQTVGSPYVQEDPGRGPASEGMCGPDGLAGPEGAEIGIQMPCIDPLGVGEFISYGSSYHQVVVGRAKDMGQNKKFVMEIRK